MAVQWFPGHMEKTRKVIAERLKNIDVVLQILDARLPGSSFNPLLGDMVGSIPSIFLLNKKDLAEENITTLWCNHFREYQKSIAFPIDARSLHGEKEELLAICRTISPPDRGTMEKPLRILICGVPNVGKSTFINHWLDKKKLKTGNEAGVTRDEHPLLLSDGVWLYDTPGMLWGKIVAQETGYRLALAGSVGKNAYDPEETLLFLLPYLQKTHLDVLSKRYRIEDPEYFASLLPEEALDYLGVKRGTITRGSRVDHGKIAELLIQDFRQGRWGPLCLERPEEWQHWQKMGQETVAQMQRMKTLRLERRKQRHKRD